MITQELADKMAAQLASEIEQAGIQTPDLEFDRLAIGTADIQHLYVPAYCPGLKPVNYDDLVLSVHQVGNSFRLEYPNESVVFIAPPNVGPMGCECAIGRSGRVILRLLSAQIVETGMRSLSVDVMFCKASAVKEATPR